MIIRMTPSCRIELIQAKHAKVIFELINNNRAFLSEWMPFVHRMQKLENVEQFVSGTLERRYKNMEFAFVIFENEIMIGRIGIYNIDSSNKIGEIGYWIDERFQGRGIITKACKKMIQYCFDELYLNRIEIKCATENIKSQAIPKKLGFTLEGVMRQAEVHLNRVVDLNLYALLKETTHEQT